MSISTQSGARGSKDVLSIILKGNSKLHSIQDSTLPKIRITSKKASNKSCLKLNFVQKSPKCICLSPAGVELGTLKDWHVRSIILQGKRGQKYTSHQKKLRIFRVPQLHSRSRQVDALTHFLVQNLILNKFYLKLFSCDAYF